MIGENTMYLALTAMTTGISYNLPLVSFNETTNITHGNLSVLFRSSLLGNWQHLLDMNDEYENGVKVAGILYKEVPTYEEAQMLFEAGALFSEIPPEHLPESESLMIPADTLTLIEGGEDSLVDMGTSIEVIPSVMPSHYLPVIDNSEVTPPVAIADGRIALTEEVLNSLSMDDLRAHGKLWNQKSRSRSTLIEEILVAQKGA